MKRTFQPSSVSAATNTVFVNVWLLQTDVVSWQHVAGVAGKIDRI